VSAVRALIVSYAFPPVGGAGVQRVLKLVKYLPVHGVTPTVLTVRNPSVPVRDPSLERDIPSGVEVVRVPTLEPSYAAKEEAQRATSAPSRGLAARAKAGLVRFGAVLLIPDSQTLWLPAAQLALASRLFRGSDDVIFISGPPFSQFWLALVARLRRDTAVVLDYRDEWRMASRTSSSGAEVLLERRLLHCAHAVTTATQAYRTELCTRFEFLDPARVHAIPNGYDPDDFPKDLPGPSGDHFVLTYVGTIFPLTTAQWLVEAVRLLHEREPELARILTLRFVVRIVDAEARCFQGTEAIGIERVGYVEHDRAIEDLARSHAAVCILDSVPGAERVYPAKIFEIMHLRKPCLVLTPEGALADLVRKHAVGEVVSSRDVPAIASALERMLRAFRPGAAPKTSAPVDVERFDRRRQAGQFAEVFRSSVAMARGRPRPIAPRIQHALPSASVHP
jgi:glycosyltransferase involved in cell wall biosynthesis